MKTVDLRCSMDGCTVQPDVDGTVKSCKDYCGSNGLKCVEAWVSKEEDCGFDTVSACDAFLEDPEAMQVCRCERGRPGLVIAVGRPLCCHPPTMKLPSQSSCGSCMTVALL